MNSINEISNILQRMAELLNNSGDTSWSFAFSDLADNFSISPSDASRKILRLYGGMGSINDLVLYRDGVYLPKENEEFDALRGELFRLCRDLV